MGDTREGRAAGVRVHVKTHVPLLGTVVEVRVETTEDRVAVEADERAVAEIGRLQRVFDAFDEGSELSRWRRGDEGATSSELGELLTSALDWQRRSAGAFNPLSDVLTARWRRAEIEDRVPDADELQELAASIREPRFEVVGGRPVRTGDCAALQLNALAKGFIVDRAVAAAETAGSIVAVTVNAGGDLLHRGESTLRVGIEDPHRPYDNEPPLTSVDLRDAGLATSGGSRRGFRVDGRRYGHVIDPSTGAPADGIASITVVAEDAATADAIATSAGVLTAEDALTTAGALGAAACLVVDRDGVRRADHGWHAIEVR